jgi:uncharacterized RDD family membrane protein YckC
VLSFDLAGPASRMAAALLDYLIITLLLLALIVALISAGVIALEVRDLFDPSALAAMNAVALAVIVGSAFGLNLLYFLLLEWLGNGQTIGKRAIGLRVVRDGGYALGFGPAFMRNVMRPVDMMPVFYVLGIVSVLASSHRKRIGDQVAGTLVVRHSKVAAPTPRFVGESYATISERRFAFDRDQLGKLGPNVQALLDDYYDRHAKIGPAYRETLTARVATSLGNELGVDPGEHQERFLKELYLALRDQRV